jgi:c(7)-type cytochrome triheme protein
MRTKQLLALLALTLLGAVSAHAQQSGKDVYKQTCFLCHATGLANSPKFGNASDWGPRIAKGTPRLYESALKGTANGMPAKGGNPSLSDAEVKAAVDFMLAAARSAAPKPAAAAAPKPANAKAAAPESKPAAVVESTPAAADPKPQAAAAAPEPVALAAVSAGAIDVNAFNRLLKPAGKRNPSPMEDGIHDPTIDSTRALLPPQTAYADLPKSQAGNRINWVEALNSGKINPRWDRSDPKAEPVVMDLNIVREVKGSMPDVVYPHKQHTQWLDCSNCHPAIFIPQKGANAISMAAILLGEKCGVCHGKVAFPVSECRLCHSKKKDFAHPATALSTEPK